jgi:hypothetical protein
VEAVGIQELTRGRHRLLWQALIVSTVFHLGAVWSLRQVPGASLRMPAAVPLEIRILAPKASMAHIPQPEAAAARRNAEDRQPKHGRESSPPVSAASSSTEETTIQLPSRPALDLSEAARRSAGAIDREMRQSGAARSGGNAQLGRSSTALERGIAAAGLPRGTVMQEVAAADGRIMTKVITPSGTYCVWGRRPGAGITESELAGVTTTTCP